jgi:uroporphyrinogen-III decarboxylase
MENASGGLRMPIDLTAHNAEQKAVWNAFHAGDPIRMPMILGINCRYWLLDPTLNTRGISFEEYTKDADLMFDCQLAFLDHRKNEVWEDAELGVPSDCYRLSVDLQNYYEAAWYGAEVVYRDGNVPDSEPLLTDDAKGLLLDRGIPGLFDGWGGFARDRYLQMKDRAEREAHNGRPIRVGAPYGGTDGPFSVGCNLRGATAFCIDMLEDPAYFHAMMDYLTESIIFRIKGWRAWLGGPERTPSMSLADDSISLMSTDMYRELVLPYHKRILDALSTGEKPNSMHLCGDAGRHFRLIRDELGVNSFDTGYPLDHAKTVAELGPDVTVYGGVAVGLLQHGTPGQVEAETRRIIAAVKDRTKKFVFREANNLPPNTPKQNLRTMYETVKEAGRYRDPRPGEIA